MGTFSSTIVEHKEIIKKSYNDLRSKRNLKIKDLQVFRQLAKELNKKIPLQTLIKQYNQQIEKIAIRRGLRNYEIEQLKDFAELKVVNKQKTDYYNRNKDIIYNYQKQTKGLSGVETQTIYDNLSNKQKQIIDEYQRLFNNYYKSKYETNARDIGKQKSKEIITYADNRATESIKGICREWNVRARRGDSSKTSNGQRKGGTGQNTTTGEASEEIAPEPVEIKGAQTRQDEIKIEKATRDSLYKWYGEVGKACYDVDKVMR